MSIGQMSVGKMYVGQMFVGQMFVGQMFVGQMSVGQMSVGQMFFDQKKWNRLVPIRLKFRIFKFVNLLNFMTSQLFISLLYFLNLTINSPIHWEYHIFIKFRAILLFG